MVWVKGELLTDLADPAVDPAGQLTRAAQPILFDRAEWFVRMANQDPEKPVLVARTASGGCVAWLMISRSGGHATSLSNWYTMAFRPVFAGDPDESRRRVMLIAIARRLATAHPKIGSVTLAPVPVEDGSADLLAHAFAKGGWSVARIRSSTSWTADTSGKSFTEYWEARPGQLRSTYKRKLGKAAFSTEVLDHFDPKAWSIYESIYDQSWKPEEGAPGFLREMAEAEASKGCLRLGICRIDDEPVAAQFWTVDHGRAYIHKLAHRESAKDASPGTVLSVAMFRHVIDVDRVSIIDFGTGDDPYKADWMDASSSLETLEAFNLGTASGLAGAARARLSRLVRGAPRG